MTALELPADWVNKGRRHLSAARRAARDTCCSAAIARQSSTLSHLCLSWPALGRPHPSLESIGPCVGCAPNRLASGAGELIVGSARPGPARLGSSRLSRRPPRRPLVGSSLGCRARGRLLTRFAYSNYALAARCAVAGAHRPRRAVRMRRRRPPALGPNEQPWQGSRPIPPLLHSSCPELLPKRSPSRPYTSNSSISRTEIN